MQFPYRLSAALVLLLSAPLALKAQTDMTTMSDCVTCIASSSQYACKSNYGDNLAYCCTSSTSSNKQCKQDFCSNAAPTTSMKFWTCPF